MKLKKDFTFHIGTAGWNIPSILREYFPPGKSLLERYSKVFNTVEINTSFYRTHQRTTYERWAATTPSDFLFAVKMPKEITHNQRLVNSERHLDQFIHEVSGLQNKLGVLLIQLPPHLKFEQKVVDEFLKILRNRFNGDVVLEPRHLSWSERDAVDLLSDHKITHVIADPQIVPIDPYYEPIFQYYRLHGTPEIYSSSYEMAFLNQLAVQLKDSSWVIFDNTKFGAATQNALDLQHLLVKKPIQKIKE